MTKPNVSDVAEIGERYRERCRDLLFAENELLKAKIIFEQQAKAVASAKSNRDEARQRFLDAIMAVQLNTESCE